MTTLEILPRLYHGFDDSDTAFDILRKLHDVASVVQSIAASRITDEHLLRQECPPVQANGDEIYGLYLKPYLLVETATPLMSSVTANANTDKPVPKEVVIFNEVGVKRASYNIGTVEPPETITTDEEVEEDKENPETVDPDDQEFEIQLRADSMIVIGSAKIGKRKYKLYEKDVPFSEVMKEKRDVIMRIYAGIIATANLVQILTSNTKIINPKLHLMARNHAITHAIVNNE